MGASAGEMLEEYIEYLKAQGKGENTIRAYSKSVDAFIKWLHETYGEADAAAVTPVDVHDYLNYLRNIRKMKPSSINQKLFAIRSFCDFLMEKGYLQTDPTRGIKALKDESRKTSPGWIEKNTLNRFRREVYKSGNLRDIAIFEVLINTGMRLSELAGLELSDVKISERKGEVHIRGKGRKNRIVPLNSSARKALMEYLNRRSSSEQKLFVGERGPLTANGIYRIIRKYAERIGLEGEIHPHVFRHNFAHTLLREHKEDIVVVSQLLGHESLDTTKVYTQPTKEELAEAVEKLG